MAISPCLTIDFNKGFGFRWPNPHTLETLQLRSTIIGEDVILLTVNKKH